MTYLYKLAAGACLVAVGANLERGDFGGAAIGLGLTAFALAWAHITKGGAE
jgi:hypothetical protein